MSQKRRALVLGDDSARHCFRASLPPHIRRAVVGGRRPFDLRGWRDIASAYCATFVAMTVFIA